MTYFIDANVPIYASGRPSELKEPCTAILQALAAGRIEAATDAEVLQEVAYQYYKRGQTALGVTVASRFSVLMPLVLPVEATDCLLMLDILMAHQAMEPRDALHYAIMRRHGISHIITADAHFDALSDIVRIDPRDAPRLIADLQANRRPATEN
jgi:predicted nucleic acid-binding protein